MKVEIWEYHYLQLDQVIWRRERENYENIVFFRFPL